MFFDRSIGNDAVCQKQGFFLVHQFKLYAYNYIINGADGCLLFFYCLSENIFCTPKRIPKGIKKESHMWIILLWHTIFEIL